MFRIRFFTPAVLDEDGWRHAGVELVAGDARLIVSADLDHWNRADYLWQWNDGIARRPDAARGRALRHRAGP